MCCRRTNLDEMHMNNSSYLMLHSYTQPGLFRWVDFAVAQNKERTEVLHVAYYVPKGERACQFGARHLKGGDEFKPQELDPKVNRVYTAFITPAGVAFRERDIKSPWRYTGQLLPWGHGPSGTELTGAKVKVLVNAMAGMWQPGQQDPFRKISVPLGAEIAAALNTLKLGYSAAGSDRASVIAKFVAMAVKVGAEGIQLGDRLNFEFTKREKRETVSQQTGLSLLEQALQDELGSSEEETSLEKETELPRSSFTADGGGNTAVAEAPETPEDQKPKKRIKNPFQD